VSLQGDDYLPVSLLNFSRKLHRSALQPVPPEPPPPQPEQHGARSVEWSYSEKLVVLERSVTYKYPRLGTDGAMPRNYNLFNLLGYD